jgi:hypothetical protein
MKTLLAFGKAIGEMVIVVISLIVIIQFIPKSTQGLSPGSPNDAYPPPATVTVTSTRTSTPVPYPPPGTAIPTRVISLIPEGTSPHPNGYPTDMPWPLPTPSNATKIPMPTPIPTIYPTPAFPAAPKGTIPSSLRKLWYVYAPDSNSRPIFQTEQIDDAVQRRGKGQVTIDIGLEQGNPGVILNDLFPSPDGKWMIAMIARDVSSQPFLINMDNGKVERILSKNSNVQFLGWKPDSQKVIVLKEAFDPGNAGEVDLGTGEYLSIEFPKSRGDLPVINAIAYSSDGNFMADALVYLPNHQEGKDYLVSIGIRDTKFRSPDCIQSAMVFRWSMDFLQCFRICIRCNLGSER